MLGKPVVLFKQDVRSLVWGRDNPMVAGMADFHLAGEFDELIDSLHRQIENHDGQAQPATQLPAHVRQAVDAGESLWRRMSQRPPMVDNAQLADVVWNLFGPAPAAGPVLG